MAVVVPRAPRASSGSPAATGPPRRQVVIGCVAAAVLALLAALAGIGVRATYNGHAAVDEPQYLLTALSLWEDHDVDISDELAGRRWEAFSDAEVPVQTAVLADRRQLSPHEPLLPLLLAAPMGLGGWVAAKCALALVAAGAAALTCWTAVRRFAVPVVLASAGTGLAFATPPLAVYGQQVYPEMPAALAVLAAVAALTGRLRRLAVAVLVCAVVALPWLGVKYVPVATSLALLGLWRLHRLGRWRGCRLMAGTLAAAGAGYLLLHQLVWGGWTVYASGSHFQGAGEFAVVGVDPDYVGRTVRLVGLLVDRVFGLVAWQPAWLLLVPAAGALLRWRSWPLLLPVAAGWATATWIALTMHGFWWPGRQLVVVLPVACVAVLSWLARLQPAIARRRALAVAALLSGVGLTTYVAVVAGGWRRELTWVVGFDKVAAPAYRVMRLLLPDYRGTGFLVPHLLWVIAALGLAHLGWVNAARATTHRPPRAVQHKEEIPQ